MSEKVRGRCRRRSAAGAGGGLPQGPEEDTTNVKIESYIINLTNNEQNEFEKYFMDTRFRGSGGVVFG